MDRLGVICHETLHALSTKQNMCGLQGNENKDYAGRTINEGMTELLTQQMVPSGYKSYKNEVKITEFLLEIFGDDMIEAYLNADFDGLLDMAKEKKIETEFMKLITLSDYKLNLSPRVEIIDSEIEEAKLAILNGSIGIYNCILQNIPLHKGITPEIIIKEIKERWSNNPEFEKTQEFDVLKRKYPEQILECMVSENNGEINFEKCLSLGLVEKRESWLAEHYFEKNSDFKKYYREVASIAGGLEKEGKDVAVITQILLDEGITAKYSEGDTRRVREDMQFKSSVIEEIMRQDIMPPRRRKAINTMRDEKGQLKYSGREMVSKIENFEYYQTETGVFVVDSKTGEMLGLNKRGELIDLEEDSKEDKENRSSKAIKYTMDDKGSKVFLTEKNKDGKYILKGYLESENGERIDLDVGLSRDFCDDMTEIDRQLISQTSDVRSGSIKKVAEKMKNEINKDKQTEKENIEVKENKEDEGR